MTDPKNAAKTPEAAELRDEALDNVTGGRDSGEAHLDYLKIAGKKKPGTPRSKDGIISMDGGNEI